LPQAPQLALSDCRSTHVPEASQYVRPAVGQMQFPPWHVAPDEERHTRPQEPQLLLSVFSSRHAPLQNDCPAVGHTHMLFMHLAPPGPRQLALQAPQLVSSFVVSTQAPLQLVSGSHLLVHMPLLQTSVAPVDAEHMVPQPPQLVGFEAMSRHWPEHNVGMAPPVHVHMPLTHCSPPGHIVPQAPQLFGSVCRSTHERLQLVNVPVPLPPLAPLLPLPPLLLPPLLLSLAAVSSPLLVSLAPVSSPLPVSLAPVSALMVVPVSPAPVSPPLPSLPPPSLTTASPLASPVPPLLLLPLTTPNSLQLPLQWPRTQTRGGEHTIPHLPQLFGSDCTSVHVWPHMVPAPVVIWQGLPLELSASDSASRFTPPPPLLPPPELAPLLLPGGRAST
jgi:hypothetical protein